MFGPLPAQFLRRKPVQGAGERGEGGALGAEARCHGVDLLLQVGAEMLGEVIDQEVDVPREVVGRFKDTGQLALLDLVPPAHGHFLHQRGGYHGGLDEGLAGEADFLLDVDGKFNGHVEVAQQPGKKRRGGDQRLVGDEHAVHLRGSVVLVLGRVVPIADVALVHPQEDLLVERAVVEGPVDIKDPPRAFAGGFRRIVLLEGLVECGDGAEGGYKDERAE